MIGGGGNQSSQGHAKNKSSKGSYFFSGNKLGSTYLNDYAYPCVNEDDCVLTALSLIM